MSLFVFFPILTVASGDLARIFSFRFAGIFRGNEENLKFRASMSSVFGGGWQMPSVVGYLRRVSGGRGGEGRERRGEGRGGRARLLRGGYGAGGGSMTERRGWRGKKWLRRTRFVILGAFFVSFVLVQWTLSSSPPEFRDVPPAPASCRADAETGIEHARYEVRERAVCSGACGRQCFPRVRGLCIAPDAVTVCAAEEDEEAPIPMHLRFAGKDQYWRRNVAVRRVACGDGADDERRAAAAAWIGGTQMVADMKMMPNGHRAGPSPHHEAEKLIPAILLARFYGLNRSSLYWFTDPVPSRVTSAWSMGVMAAFAGALDVKLAAVPGRGRRAVCFEDAVLFSGVTNAGYVPNTAANDWLRRTVLAHCGIEARRARRPARDVVIISRMNSSRAIQNTDEVEAALERELRVPVKRRVSGEGDFCAQARVIAEADVFVTPHGSHNVNFLFARPGAVVLEAFPLLYYIDWFRNYVHSARLHHRELFGTWPTDHAPMPFWMTVYALLFGWKDCFSVRQCMNYAKRKHVSIDIHQLERHLRELNG